jgi:hypothetical protein
LAKTCTLSSKETIALPLGCHFGTFQEPTLEFGPKLFGKYLGKNQCQGKIAERSRSSASEKEAAFVEHLVVELLQLGTI